MNANRYSLIHHTDDQLLRSLEALIGKANNVTALVLAHLAEVDARMLFAKLGFPSLFAYATEGLGLSESSAFKRIQCARLSRRLPVVLDWVAAGDVHLAGLVVLAAHMTDDNHLQLLAAARRKSKRAVEEMIAARFPRPDVPQLLRAMPTPSLRLDAPVALPRSMSDPITDAVRPALRAGAGSAPAATATGPAAEDEHEPKAPPAPALPPSSRSIVEPLSAQRFRLQVTLSRRARDLLVRAQELMRHQVPDGDLSAVCEHAFESLVAELERRKFASRRKKKSPAADAAPNPGQASPGKPRSRHIPNDVKRRVAQRDGRQCTYVGSDGRRCSARALVEFHHRQPFARGGASTVDGLTLYCRAHNQYAARHDFGEGFMRARRKGESGWEAREARVVFYCNRWPWPSDDARR